MIVSQRTNMRLSASAVGDGAGGPGARRRGSVGGVMRRSLGAGSPGGRHATLVAAPCGQDIRPFEVDGAGRAFSPGTQEALRRRPSRAPMMRTVDDLVGPATRVANAAIDPDG